MDDKLLKRLRGKVAMHMLFGLGGSCNYGALLRSFTRDRSNYRRFSSWIGSWD